MASKIPANVRSLAAAPGDRSVKLTYEIPPDVDHVVITRSIAGGAGQVVYNGKAATYIDRGLTNALEYRYVVVSADAAGNRSAGVAIVAVPRRNRLRSPKDGARLKKPPKLVWAAETEADYYNAQLLRNGVKILSVWPRKTSFTLKKTWKFRGRTYSLSPGIYEWFVWPGFGPIPSDDYGELLGSRTFRIVR